ncbi:sensor histidine kinase [Paenibacillus abyssi]|uniref:histidine kinase n=1 Tax=Paenibacillus abyssi TaxID=1340531 RepID=A0A917CYS0_9BACL|nr:sensor histidine kinase [Paenibacillus abyssi]GGG00163.1 hypothetical protein GCM10010916_16730 [Paenibacillus abyssi]
MKRWTNFTWPKLMTMGRIVPKMILGYLLLVVFPVILFGTYLYNQIHNDMLDNYSSDKQNLINQAANNMEMDLARVDSIYTLFQYNPTVINALSGAYKTNATKAYTYLKDIRPMFTFASLGNKSIQSIKIYKMNQNVLLSSSEIQNIDQLERPFVHEKLKDIKAGKGLWIPINYEERGSIPSLSYFQHIYDNTYIKELAILNVTFKDDPLNSFLQTINVGNGVNVAIFHQGYIFFKDKELKISNQQLRDLPKMIGSDNNSYMIWKKNNLLVNHIYLENLNLDFYFLSSVNQVMKDINEKSIIFGVVLLLLLIILSSIYYLTASVLTKRVVNLAKHMRRVDENQLSVYRGEKGNDEISFLTESYNSLIKRIDELMNKVHRAEIMKRKAEYKALEAQVNPHFLYNTLESIRMLAEMNDDQEVVESTFTLSKLLRYSLSSGSSETTLEQEVENIRDYLSIHKIRMMDRLQYEIQIEATIKNIHCPRFILQPLVENSIKHGLSKSRKPGWIRVAIHENDDQIELSISDNGKGMTRERLEKVRSVLNNELDRSLLQTDSSGLGVSNVSERIKNYFGNDSRIEVTSNLDDGTTFNLILKKQRGKNSA